MSVTVPLPAALVAFAVLFVVAVGIGACRVSARRFIGPWGIDRRAESRPTTVRVDHVVRRAYSDEVPPTSARRVIESHAVPAEDPRGREGWS